MALNIEFNGNTYPATYNTQTGYFELNLTAPEEGGVYQIDATYTDALGQVSTASELVRVLLNFIDVELQPKTFMWIFDHKDLTTKGCVEIQDYELNIDEETNATSIITILKDTGAVARDYVIIKKNNEKIYWGIIEEIANEDGDKVYTYQLKYLTNLFDRNIKLEYESMIRTTGIEDFIATEIAYNFMGSTDTFINLQYLEVTVKTHTKKQIGVSNVENGIYNLHTWMTNCTQNYNITYDFEIETDNLGVTRLKITIQNTEPEKEIIDVNAQPISNYQEVFETDVTAKVTCLYSMMRRSGKPTENITYIY